MSYPSVSIVLPTYNGTRYLAQSIQSCLSQTFEDLELIIVDDCSTDQTPQIIAEFAARDQRIRTVRHETNRRLPGAINTGFSLSRARYLSWTSDDNMYRPDAIAKMVDALEQHPEVGLVYARMTLIDADGRAERQAFQGPVDWLLHTNVVAACFLYRREVYETIGRYAEDLFLVEDWDYWIRTAERFRLLSLPDDLYLYRRHEGSLTQQKQEALRRAELQVLMRYLPGTNSSTPAARSRGYYRAARIAWCLNQKRDAGGLIYRALAESPSYSFFQMVRLPFKRLKAKLF